MGTWMGWSAKHKWVSRSLARDEWIARTSDDQIVSNVTACKLALTTRAHDFLTANDGPNFLRAARALSVHVPPIQRVADVSERIKDLSDVPDAPRAERRAIRDAARQKNEETPVTPWRDHSPECCGVAAVLRCGPRSPASGNSSRSEARVMPECCRAVPPSPPLQIPCDGPAFGGRAGRVVRDHAGGFPVAGQHDFRGGRAARRQFGREPDAATVGRHARLDAGGAGGRGEAALNLQRGQPDHPIRGEGVGPVCAKGADRLRAAVLQIAHVAGVRLLIRFRLTYRNQHPSPSVAAADTCKAPSWTRLGPPSRATRSSWSPSCCTTGLPMCTLSRTDSLHPNSHGLARPEPN